MPEERKFSDGERMKASDAPVSADDAEVVTGEARAPLASMVLPNGMPVEFFEDLSPQVADVAVCSTDQQRNEGALNRFVFDSLGIPASRLESVELPASILEADGGKQALVIQTVGRHRTWSHTARSLRDGVQPLVVPDGIETLWTASVGAGAGGLGLEDSFRVCLHTLGTLNGVGRFRTLFSLARDQSLPDALALEKWTEAEAPLPPIPGGLEGHVSQALALAETRAGGEPINAGNILECVLALESRSRAFHSFANLLSLPPPSFEADVPKSLDGHDPQQPLRVSPHVALSFLGLPDYMRGQGRKIWGRELVAALLLSRDPSLEGLARKSGISVASLRNRWLAFVLTDDRTPSPREDWVAWWQDYGFQTGAAQRSGYLPELLQTEDQLDIEKEADAFASLICDESIAPPLSIALIGDWGSGKSFFMNKVKAKVASYNDQPGYCRNAVAIDFNAWHMSDANLWAGLVDHIFQKLQSAMLKKNVKGDAFRNELESARGAVHAAQEEVEAAIEDLEDAQNKLHEATEAVRDRKFVEDVGSAAKALGLGDAYDSILDVERAVKELAGSADESRKVMSAALQPSSLRNGLWWVGGSVVAGALIVTVGSFLPEDYQWDNQVASALRTLGTIGGVVGAIAGGVAGSLRKGAALVGDFNKTVRAEMAQYKKELERPESDASKARARYEAANADLRAATANLERVEATGGARDPRRNLLRFIVERAASEDYRAQQGLISLVRRDFEKLAEMMSRIRELDTDPEAHAKANGNEKAWREEAELVDRVVLYIDDLDRCKPKRVVEVLEAVHLLLGLDLFVVVVAVDSRWMLRALQVHYDELLTAGNETNGEMFRESTPQNYLEKIFQIPFALAPMSEGGFQKYVRFLVRDGAERVVDAEPDSTEPSPPASPSSPDSTDPQGGREPAADRAEPDDRAEEQMQAATWGRDDPAENAPRIVVITRSEREVMERLGSLIPTPRQAKRLANVFRLIKLQIDERRLARFEEPDSGSHRAVLVLLAVLFGHPNVARPLFRSIYELAELPQGSTLCAYLDEWPAAHAHSAVASNGTLAAEVLQLNTLLKRHDADVALADCAAWVGHVSRYSLVTGQEWHTWVKGRAVQDIEQLDAAQDGAEGQQPPD